MLQHLHEGRIDALRQLIYDCGREYPRAELVTHLLRPLRSKVSAHLPAVMTLREVLDGIIISYTTFCLEGDRKAPGYSAFISGWNLSDHCEIWLEALTRTGQGLRIDILPSPPTVLGARTVLPEKMVPGDPPESSLPGRKNSSPNGTTLLPRLSLSRYKP
ncbi:MerR family transcriptional regulator [Salmonella enterica subsp. arizonae]|uniref:MerR family transcriptional regulator n=1 Tax=Salmonella enterica subsp. arizonae TaxID=59203 RepID=A0A379S5M8_SALER|nr:MerR family transcriptional regulator [Salmonella enterica subsp. arizonae]